MGGVNVTPKYVGRQHAAMAQSPQPHHNSIVQDNANNSKLSAVKQREIRNNSQLAIKDNRKAPHGALLGNSNVNKQVMMSLTKRHNAGMAGMTSNKWLPNVSHDNRKSRPGNGSKRGGGAGQREHFQSMPAEAPSHHQQTRAAASNNMLTLTNAGVAQSVL